MSWKRHVPVSRRRSSSQCSEVSATDLFRHRVVRGTIPVQHYVVTSITDIRAQRRWPRGSPAENSPKEWSFLNILHVGGCHGGPFHETGRRMSCAPDSTSLVLASGRTLGGGTTFSYEFPQPNSIEDTMERSRWQRCKM